MRIATRVAAPAASGHACPLQDTAAHAPQHAGLVCLDLPGFFERLQAHTLDTLVASDFSAQGLPAYLWPIFLNGQLAGIPQIKQKLCEPPCTLRAFAVNAPSA